MILSLLFLLPCLSVLLAFASDPVAAVDWDEKNYPDPTKDGFRQCGMPSKSLVCDVDRMLSENQRGNLNSMLVDFENATYHPDGETPCKRKGTTLAIAIVDKIGEEMQKQEKLSYFAVFLHAKWTLDDECKKSLLILLPTKNWRLISRDFNYEAPVFFDEFNYIFFREQELFKSASYYEALSNIVLALKKAILAKTKELGEDAPVQYDQFLSPKLVEWEERQNQSLQRLENLMDELANRQQEEAGKDGELIIASLLNNTSTEWNSSLAENQPQIIDDSQEVRKCKLAAVTELNTAHYLTFLAMICACYVVLRVLSYVLECLWMLFKTRKSYNVGIKEQKSSCFKREECTLSTTELTTAAAAV